MAVKDRQPNKTSIKSTSRVVKNRAADSEGIKPTDEQIDEIKKIQEAIDKYNNESAFEIDPVFKDITLEGAWVVVRLFQENFIKFIDESNPKDIQLDAWIRQIDARERNTDPPKWVATPFPYVEQGVVVAVSPRVILEAYELKESLAKYDKEAAEQVHIPSVGDVVTIRANHSQWYKDHRYYIDKQAQCKDFVRNQVELRLGNFQHYFKLETYEIEAWHKNGKKGKYKKESAA